MPVPPLWNNCSLLVSFQASRNNNNNNSASLWLPQNFALTSGDTLWLCGSASLMLIWSGLSLKAPEDRGWATVTSCEDLTLKGMANQDVWGYKWSTPNSNYLANLLGEWNWSCWLWGLRVWGHPWWVQGGCLCACAPPAPFPFCHQPTLISSMLTSFSERVFLRGSKEGH